MKMIIRHKYSVLIILILFFILIIPQKFDSHIFDTKTVLGFENLQGLECLKENNELYIISTENGGSLHEGNSLSKVASFQNPDRNYDKAINFMANTNSFIKIGEIGIAVNTSTRIAPNITTYDFEKHMSSGFLSNDVVLSVLPQNDYKTLHIELVNFGEENYILTSGNKKNSTPILEFLKMNKTNALTENGLNIPKINSVCQIPGKSRTQNIYWDDSRSELVLARNSFFTRGSRIDRIKFLNPELLSQGICPSFKIVSSTLLLTHKELEAYSRCGNSEYFLYNHTSSLYERKKEK
jgi:hypothetical protein